MEDDEIKEILEQLEWYRKIGKKDVYYPECVLSNKKAFILLDYITNLQQRIEKAIKYLNNKNIYDNEYGEFIYYQYLIHDHLIDILNGRSDE